MKYNNKKISKAVFLTIALTIILGLTASPCLAQWNFSPTLPNKNVYQEFVTGNSLFTNLLIQNPIESSYNNERIENDLLNNDQIHETTSISDQNISAQIEPVRDFIYMLKFNDTIAVYFTECSGIGSENEVVEYRTMGDGTHEIINKIPGKIVWHDITLRRSISSDMTIWQWRRDLIVNTLSNVRKNITITLLDRNHTPLAAWHFNNAWPRSVTFNPRPDDIATEELIICHEGMYRE